jgi:hypothetical protein
MVAGVEYMLVVTDSPGSVSLQFKHHDAPTPVAHPDVTNVAGAVVVRKFLCPSPVMALVFSTAPSVAYRVSVLPVTTPEF